MPPGLPRAATAAIAGASTRDLPSRRCADCGRLQRCGGDPDPDIAAIGGARACWRWRSPPSGAVQATGCAASAIWRRNARRRRPPGRLGRSQSAADPRRRFRSREEAGVLRASTVVAGTLDARSVQRPPSPAVSPQRRTVPASSPNRSRTRPRVWSIISSRRLRLGIKGRHRRGDHRAHLGERRHRPQMPGMERRLAHQQHEAAAFLEHDIGGAGQQRRRHPGGDLGHAADRARRDDHAERRERARRDRRRHVADRVDDIGAGAQIGGLQIGFERQRHLGRCGSSPDGSRPAASCSSVRSRAP